MSCCSGQPFAVLARWWPVPSGAGKSTLAACCSRFTTRSAAPCSLTADRSTQPSIGLTAIARTGRRGGRKPILFRVDPRKHPLRPPHRDRPTIEAAARPPPPTPTTLSAASPTATTPGRRAASACRAARSSASPAAPKQPDPRIPRLRRSDQRPRCRERGPGARGPRPPDAGPTADHRSPLIDRRPGADRVVVLDGGASIESGPHAELDSTPRRRHRRLVENSSPAQPASLSPAGAIPRRAARCPLLR